MYTRCVAKPTHNAAVDTSKNNLHRSRRILGVIAAAIVGLGAASFTLAELDYARALEEEEPWFSARFAVYKDGGSTGYLGFGYRVLRRNALAIHDGQPGMRIGAELTSVVHRILLGEHCRGRSWFVGEGVSRPRIPIEEPPNCN